MEKEFNKNHWQGRRKDQVDYAHSVSFIAVAAVLIILVVLIVTN